VEIIPVIDLLDGEVVYAQRGQRSQYKPINSALCATSRPLEVVRALLKLYLFPRLYIADLNAIQHQGDNASVVAEIQSTFPQLDIWLDGGPRSPNDLGICQKTHLSCVVGSENLQSVDHFLNMAEMSSKEMILSLDFDAHGFIGPADLLDNPRLWPKNVIVMTLAQVGSKFGPDLSKLLQIQRVCRPIEGKDWQIYAAGGIRNTTDIRDLEALGVAGTLVATALHYGSITPDEIDLLCN